MLAYLVSSGLDDFVERVQDVEVQEREEAVLQVEVSTEKATVTWHKVITIVVNQSYCSSFSPRSH